MDNKRRFWLRQIDRAFSERRVVWLAGVRRVGKTMLSQSVENAHYYDCELLRVRSQLEDPEFFWQKVQKQLVVLDEIHRLPNPSEVLKIAADHFPTVRVLATGSSTLAAKRKFTDNLAGRKRELWLLPLIAADMEDFGDFDLERRMLHGGLPEHYLRDRPRDTDYEEWMASYWARDLSELFVVEKKNAFMRFIELLFAQSGSLFEAQTFTAPCEISRPTVMQYLSILETTLVASVVRPYFGGAAAEIKSQPKVYAFDTGFVSYFKGWDALRDEDRGLLLEHLVLGELYARVDRSRVHYWRDKQKHEVDFIVEVGRKRTSLAIECKLKSAAFSATNLSAFRTRHPTGKNWVITCRDSAAFSKRYGNLEVEFIPYRDFPEHVEALFR